MLPVGVTIPAVVRGGKVWASANIDPSWVGCHGQCVLADAVGCTTADVPDMVWPDLVVLGGGVSKDSDRFLPFIDIGVPVVIAHLGNSGGVVGAALRAVM